MKIRTDFVTNSSSSSYAVELCFSSENGKSVKLYVDPTDEYIGGGGEAVMKDWPLYPETIDELYQQVLESIYLEDADFDDLEDDISDIAPVENSLTAIFGFLDNLANNYGFDDEKFEEYDLEYFRKVQKELETFLHTLKTTFSDISEIEHVEINQIHSAWGEFVSSEEFEKDLTKDFSEDSPFHLLCEGCVYCDSEQADSFSSIKRISYDLSGGNFSISISAGPGAML